MMNEKDMLNPDENMDLSEGQGGNENENLVLNLDDVDEKGPGFEALKPGVYDCVIENTEFGESKKGNPMITWVLKVTDPNYEGRLLFNHTTLNNNMGIARLKRILVRVVPDVDLAQFNPKAFCDNGEAIGLPCRAKVSIQNYQGEKRNNVKEILPPQNNQDSFLEGME